MYIELYNGVYIYKYPMDSPVVVDFPLETYGKNMDKSSTQQVSREPEVPQSWLRK